MFFDMTKEQREEFTEKLHVQLNYGMLKNGEKKLTKLYIMLSVFLAVGLAFLLIPIVDIWLFYFWLMLPFIIWYIVIIIKYVKAYKKALDTLIKDLSENLLDYKEYKKFKQYFIRENNNG